MQLFFFVLFLLSSNVAPVTATAECHSDRDKDHRPRKNCTALGLSDVPAGFETTTKVLLFPNNLFSSLSWSSFQTFTEIYKIDLTGNKVPELTSSVTPILPTLSVLRLTSNRLTSLSDGSFSACPALTELYLDNNAIDSLSDHTFSGLSQLEILDLSSNRIQVLPQLMLHPLPTLETLYLEKNKIKVMPDDWFSQKEEVPYLFLSANPWACSCSPGYLDNYLDEYEMNVYTRDGPIITSNVESVVCDSPHWLKDVPVINLRDSGPCSSTTELRGDFLPPIATTTTTTTTPIPTTTTTPIPTTTTTPIPITTTPIPTTTTPIPITTTPIPTTTTPIPTTTTTTPIPTTTTPIPTTTTPIPTTTTTPIPTTTSTTTPIPTTTTTTATMPAIIALYTSPTPPLVSPTNATPTTVSSIATSTTTARTPLWVIDGAASSEISAVRGARVFCFWLFVGCLLLCVASAACILATLVWLVFWYRRVYKPLSVMLARRGGGGEVVSLLTFSRSEGKEVAGAGGGVMALYRSVLFINREGEETTEREGETGGEARNERLLVTLEPTGGGAMRKEEGERGGKEEKGMYRKTLYRLFSKEEELEGWRSMREECQVSAEGGGGRPAEGRSGGEVSRKSYSVILREEAGGGKEEVDWVVGGWEVKQEGEEPRSSWGEWLAHYLPSMPWGVTTPPEGEAAQ